MEELHLEAAVEQNRLVVEVERLEQILHQEEAIGIGQLEQPCIAGSTLQYS